MGANAKDSGSMLAVVTTGIGGYDRLDYRHVLTPTPGPKEVLLQVLGAGINNTDINTRLGWYAKSIKTGTGETAADAEHSQSGWSGATPFPIIQGTDCCGRVVSVGPGGAEHLIGARVLVRSCMRKAGFGSMETMWLGSDFDGAFAQYVKVPENEIFVIDCDWSDAELATIPCAYGTAENMVQRASVAPGQRVLVTGASGGVGSALVQLVKRRGAEVFAVTGASKRKAVMEIGADDILYRDDDPVAKLGENSIDVVIDNVAGPTFGNMLKLIKRGGRYVSSGAIAGAAVALDMRDMYLKDITLIGCTAWDEPVFPSLISYIEGGEIRPLLAAVYPLERIAEAQRAFMEKEHIGKIVLIPQS